jgi:hypothetical protein
LLHAQHFSSTPNISSPIYHEHREFTINSRLSHDKLAQSFTTYMLESYRCILNSIGHELKLNINNSNIRRNSLMNSIIKKNNNFEHIRRSSLTSSSKQGGKDAEIDKLLKTIETEFENYDTRATIHRFYATKTE